MLLKLSFEGYKEEESGRLVVGVEVRGCKGRGWVMRNMGESERSYSWESSRS